MPFEEPVEHRLDLLSPFPSVGHAEQGRESVLAFSQDIDNADFDDPIAVELAAFLQSKRAEVLDLIWRTERLAQELQTRSPELIVCHSDIHAGNILIDASGTLYIVDWDNPIRAPKERDLMFVGGVSLVTRIPPKRKKLYSTWGMVKRSSIPSRWRIITMSVSFKTLR